MLRGHATQASDHCNPLQHLQPYFMANPTLVGSADLPVAEDVCSRTVSPPGQDDIAHDHVARVLAAVPEGGSQ